jgi:hypothetical protein
MLSFEDLPDEVVLKILRYSEIKDLIVYGQVSKRIRKISHDNTLWERETGGITPLHEAARNGHVEHCKHILRHVKEGVWKKHSSHSKHSRHSKEKTTMC